jgi:AbrB family looped-hinge helix DNA binding protein
MSETVQVRQRGTVTLPASLREKYGIEPGDTFRIIDLDGVFVLTPMVPMVPELAREIERLRQDAGLTTEELLGALREQRERYRSERNDESEAG